MVTFLVILSATMLVSTMYVCLRWGPRAPQECHLPPRGWWCSRTPGHESPCAARPRWWNRSRFARIYRRNP